MKSRRFMGCPLLRLSAGHYHTVAEERRCASQQKLRDDVADGSNSVMEVMSAARPLFHRERKSARDLAMSQTCQKRSFQPTKGQLPGVGLRRAGRSRKVRLRTRRNPG